MTIQNNIECYVGSYRRKIKIQDGYQNARWPPKSKMAAIMTIAILHYNGTFLWSISKQDDSIIQSKHITDV